MYRHGKWKHLLHTLRAIFNQWSSKKGRLLTSVSQSAAASFDQFLRYRMSSVQNKEQAEC